MCRRRNFLKYTLSFATCFCDLIELMGFAVVRHCGVVFISNRFKTEYKQHGKNYLEQCEKLRILQNTRLVGQRSTVLASLMAIFHHRLVILD